MALYNSYDQYVNSGAPPQDLYGSYDAMPGAPGGGLQSSYDMPMYNSYDSYIGPGPQNPYAGAPGMMDPYAGFNPNAGSRAPNPNYDHQDIRGVGITFDQRASATGSAAVFVKSIASGSSADRSGRVHRGDILLRVNGVDFAHRPISELRPVIPGPAGSVVRLSFRRYDGSVYDVDLKRTSARLGSKNSRYYSGMRGYGSPQPTPNPHAAAMHRQQQMMMQQQQQQYMYQQQAQKQMMMQNPYMMDPYGGMMASQPVYLDGGMGMGMGASYIMAPQATQGISYISQPQVTYAAAPAPVYSTTSQQSAVYVDRPDAIKGTQV